MKEILQVEEFKSLKKSSNLIKETIITQEKNFSGGISRQKLENSGEIKKELKLDLLVEKAEKKRVGDTTLAHFGLKDFNKIYAKLTKALRIYANREVKKECRLIFNGLRREMHRHSKYEHPDKLIPIIAYLILKKRGFYVRVSDFLKFMRVSRKTFSVSFKRVMKLYSDLQKKNKQKIIIKKLINLKWYFNLEDEFLVVSVRTLNNFWYFIEFAKEEISAGLVSIFTLIRMEIPTPSFNEICKFLIISMGSINNRVKKLMKEIFRAEKFESLRRSSDLIRDIIITRERGFINSILVKKSENSSKIEEYFKSTLEKIDMVNSIIESMGYGLPKETFTKINDFLNTIEEIELLERLNNKQIKKFFNIVNYVDEEKLFFKNDPQRRRDFVKMAVIDYLVKNKISEYFGFFLHLQGHFSSAIPLAINELIDEGKISIFRFKKVDLYILPHTEEQITIEVEMMKAAIFSIISKNEITTLRALKKRMNISFKFLKSLLSDLISQSKIFIEKLTNRKFYSSEVNPDYQDRLEKKIEGIQEKVEITKKLKDTLKKTELFNSIKENKGFGLFKEVLPKGEDPQKISRFVKTYIINYLEKSKFSEYWGFVVYFQGKFPSIITLSIIELIEKFKISTFKYGKIDFYILAQTEEQVKAEMEIVKSTILDIIIKNGPVALRVLRKRANKKLKAYITLKFLKSLLLDLISQSKIFIETFNCSNLS